MMLKVDGEDRTRLTVASPHLGSMSSKKSGEERPREGLCGYHSSAQEGSSDYAKWTEKL